MVPTEFQHCRRNIFARTPHTSCTLSYDVEHVDIIEEVIIMDRNILEGALLNKRQTGAIVLYSKNHT